MQTEAAANVIALCTGDVADAESQHSPPLGVACRSIGDLSPGTLCEQMHPFKVLDVLTMDFQQMEEELKRLKEEVVEKKTSKIIRIPYVMPKSINCLTRFPPTTGVIKDVCTMSIRKARKVSSSVAPATG